MNRAPQHETGRPRRRRTGVVLIVATASAVLATTLAALGSPDHGAVRSFANLSGATGVLGLEGSAGNAFFQPLGTNGRSCATCHLPAQGWTITPAEVRDRFARTDGLDPIFRTNDGSNCEGANVSTKGNRHQAFSLLLSKGRPKRRRRPP